VSSEYVIGCNPLALGGQIAILGDFGFSTSARKSRNFIILMHCLAVSAYR